MYQFWEIPIDVTVRNNLYYCRMFLMAFFPQIIYTDDFDQINNIAFSYNRHQFNFCKINQEFQL